MKALPCIRAFKATMQKSKKVKRLKKELFKALISLKLKGL
jgi:hypothetical protein